MTKSGLFKMLSVDKMTKKFRFLTKPSNINKVLFLLGFLLVLFLVHKHFLSQEGFESTPEELEENVQNNVVTLEGVVQDVEDIKQQITVLMNRTE